MKMRTQTFVRRGGQRQPVVAPVVAGHLEPPDTLTVSVACRAIDRAREEAPGLLDGLDTLEFEIKLEEDE